MLLQQSIEQRETQGEPRGHAEQEGIVVPLDLGEFRLLKRRFRCLTCRRSFTEADQACGKRRRTTTRLREHIG